MERLAREDRERVEHALQTNLVQRLARGLTYDFTCTCSKSMDNGSANFTESSETANGVGTSWAFDPTINRGVSDYDIGLSPEAARRVQLVEEAFDSALIWQDPHGRLRLTAAPGIA
jgi:hypothetical protein